MSKVMLQIKFFTVQKLYCNLKIMLEFKNYSMLEFKNYVAIYIHSALPNYVEVQNKDALENYVAVLLNYVTLPKLCWSSKLC